MPSTTGDRGNRLRSSARAHPARQLAVPHGPVGEVGEPLRGDGGRLGDVGAELHAAARHRGCPHPSDDELHHVDPVRLQLVPEALRDHSAERLGGVVDRAVGRGRVPGERPDEHDATSAALLHPPTEVVAERQSGQDVEVGDDAEPLEVPVDERRAVGVGPGVHDQQAHVHVVGDRSDPVQHVGSREVDGEGPYVDASGPGRGGRRLERLGVPGQQDEVEAGGGQQLGKGGADALGATGDHGPGSVPFEVHERWRVPRATPAARLPGWSAGYSYGALAISRRDRAVNIASSRALGSARIGAGRPVAATTSTPGVRNRTERASAYR